MTALKPITAKGKGSVGVILPDTVSSARYTEFDAPYLSKALTMAGLSPSQFSVQNAQGSDTTEFTIAQEDITKGASVLVMDPLDSGVGAKIETYAAQHGVKVIDYDRLTVGGSRAVLRQLQQRPGRHPDRAGPHVLRHGLEREEPAGARHAGRADRQQRDPVRPGLRRRAGAEVLQRRL